jgi:hypothetical protein
MDRLTVETRCLFELMREARLNPLYTRFSEAFRAAREQLEKSENRAISQQAKRLPAGVPEFNIGA